MSISYMCTRFYITIFCIHFYIAGHFLKEVYNKHLVIPNNSCLCLIDIDWNIHPLSIMILWHEWEKKYYVILLKLIHTLSL